MKDNISRIDSKGRISIPLTLRERLDLSPGSEFTIKVRNSEIIATPLSSSGKKIDITMNDSNQIRSIMKFMDRNKINIMSSESRQMGQKVRWSAVVDFNGDVRELKKRLACS